MRRVESLLKIKNPEPLPSRSDSNGHAHVFLKSALLACLITLSACSIPNPFNQKKATPAKSATVVAASSTPDHLELVSGNLQTGAVMAPLKDLLRFKVVNAKGEPVSHARFLISANKGGGTVTSASIESDSKGLVSIPWTLGKIAGSQSITFSGTDRFTSNPDSLTFSATATARAPSAQKSSISGSGPVAADGAQASLITIFLRDEFGNPVSGAKPAFTATDSGNSNLYGGCSASDATGISLCSLSSTTAEIKTPRLTWPVNLTGPGISFIKPSSNKPVLSFSTAPPSSATAGQVLSPAPVVSLLDSSGRVVRTRNPVVIEAFADSACTQALGSTPSGDPNLSGSTTRSALTAPATFNDLSANRAGVVFLKASSDSLDPV
ncbi:MAG: hypothetical protein EBX52_05050, partial [Proteobacteria bacterium]|nr:hypothetical protein [Pseudomonadota bacterium]